VTTAEKKRPGRKPDPNARKAFLNIRIGESELEALKAHAAVRGIPYGELVRHQLGALLRPPKGHSVPPATKRPPRATRARAARPSASTESHTVDLAQWVGNRVGLPAAIVKRYVDGGRILVGGEECREARVTLEQIREGVSFDGQAL
jgi:hypothetical protein